MIIVAGHSGGTRTKNDRHYQRANYALPIPNGNQIVLYVENTRRSQANRER